MFLFRSHVRKTARQSRNVYVCTGPLYLSHKDPNDGRFYVRHEVIGEMTDVIRTETNTPMSTKDERVLATGGVSVPIALFKSKAPF